MMSLAMEGVLADNSQSLILEALQRVVVESHGLPLYSGKTGGLFAATATGRLAAQACKDDGLIEVLRTETRGKAAQEICGITAKGRALLLGQTNPRSVLERLVETLEARDRQLCDIADAVARARHDLAFLRTATLQILDQVQLRQHIPGAGSWETNGKHDSSDLPASVKSELQRWHDAGMLGDCPLPELFRRLRPAFPDVTIGQFHDQLRLLHQGLLIYLHPWTGPLYELPEPAFALLAGHEIAYYASLR
jgi:hypothetical protein